MLLDEQLDPKQIEIYRKMTPQQRLAVAEQLYWSAREWKAAALRARHPEWSEKTVAEEVTRIFRDARN
jgi:hypothetical protein